MAIARIVESASVVIQLWLAALVLTWIPVPVIIPVPAPFVGSNTDANASGTGPHLCWKHRYNNHEHLLAEALTNNVNYQQHG